MDKIKYYYESNENRLLPEDEQGYAEVTLISAKEDGEITNMLVSESLKSGKKIKVDMAGTSLKMNRKHIHKIYNVKDPLTDSVTEEMTIDQIYNSPTLKELYTELSNAVGDISLLKEGIKKN